MSMALSTAEIPRLVEELTGRAPPASRSAAEWEAAYGRVIEALVSAKDFPEPGRKSSRPPKAILDEIVRRAMNPEKATQRSALSRALLARLEKMTELDERIFCLRQLAVIGGDESVSAIAELLHDADGTVRQYALGALECNPSPAAGRALVEALRGAGEPAWRVAILHALGRRREAAAEPALAERTADRDDDVACAATMALANLGVAVPEEALPAASPLRFPARGSVRFHATLLRAERLAQRGDREAARAAYAQVFATAKAAHLRAGALSGLVRTAPDQAIPHILEALRSAEAELQAHAARLAVEIPGKDATKQFLAVLPQLPAPAQAMLSESLAERSQAAPETPKP
jgi:HEAT repeat protein